MNNNKLKILLKEVGKESKIQEIEDTLEAKQKLVGGLIEVVPFQRNSDILIVCNEEGKILNMFPNVMFGYDYIAGDCFFIRDDYKGGFESLTDEDIKDIKKNLVGKTIHYAKDELALLQAEQKKFNEDYTTNLNDFFNDYYKDIINPINERSDDHLAEENI